VTSRALPVIALTLLATVGTAQEPKLQATAGKTEVGVGETFTVEVKAEAPADTEWVFPAEAGDEKVELWTEPPAPNASPIPAGTHRYRAVALTLSEAVVPPIRARYRLPDGTEGEAASGPLALRIVSALPKDAEKQQLADIRGPVPLAISLSFWIAVAALVALLGIVGVWLMRRRRAARPLPEVVPELPPDMEARQALDRLVSTGMLARGELRPFYIALTEIAKRYLERRLHAPVLEMTSAEAVAFLRDHVHGHALAPVLRDLQVAADEVKFARGAGQLQEAERHLAAVRALLDALEARLVPRPAEKVA
jgi:hypothetical protein